MYMEVVALIQSQPDVEQHCMTTLLPQNSAVIHRDQKNSDFSFWMVVVCSKEFREGRLYKVNLLYITTALPRVHVKLLTFLLCPCNEDHHSDITCFLLHRCFKHSIILDISNNNINDNNNVIIVFQKLKMHLALVESVSMEKGPGSQHGSCDHSWLTSTAFCKNVLILAHLLQIKGS